MFILYGNFVENLFLRVVEEKIIRFWIGRFGVEFDNIYYL